MILSSPPKNLMCNTASSVCNVQILFSQLRRKDGRPCLLEQFTSHSAFLLIPDLDNVFYIFLPGCGVLSSSRLTIIILLKYLNPFISLLIPYRVPATGPQGQGPGNTEMNKCQFCYQGMKSPLMGTGHGNK